jgi:hypothetical protein
MRRMKLSRVLVQLWLRHGAWMPQSISWSNGSLLEPTRSNDMSSSDAFPSKYLRSADILGKGDVPVVLGDIKHEEMADGEKKYVLYFQDKVKGLVLNKTNWDVLEEAFGDSDDWPGKPATLFTVKTRDPAGKPVDGIRIKDRETPPKQKIAVGKPQLKAVSSENPAADMDDEIPF